MWTSISSTADIKKGMELFRSFDALTGKVFKVIYVSGCVMQVIPLKYITPKGEFYVTSLESDVLSFDMNRVSGAAFYLQN